jgi:entericidin A
MGRKGHMKKLILLAAIAVLSVTVFTGCETTKGAGKDIERAGEKIQDAAK